MAKIMMAVAKSVEKRAGAHRVAQSEGEAAIRLLDEKGYPSKRRQNGQSESRCPFHEEPGELGRGATKFYVNQSTSQFACHSASCQAKGNLITLERHFGVDPVYTDDSFVSREKQLKGWEANLKANPARRQVFYEHGLEDSTIERFRFGYDADKDRYVIPYLDGKTPVAFRFYNPDPGTYHDQDGVEKRELKYYWEKGVEVTLYNHNDAGGDDKGRTFLCEGELKAAALAQMGYSAVATPGAGMFKEEWHKFFSDARQIYIIYDNDNPKHPKNKRDIEKCAPCRSKSLEECAGHNAGQDGAAKAMDALGWRAHNLVLPLPDDDTRKTDVNEYFVRDGHTASDFAEWALGEKSEPYKVLTLAEIMQDPPEEPTMLVANGILPTQGRLLIAGKPKIGKSLFAENMALSLASGIPFLGEFEVSEPTRVLLLDRELSRSSLYERLMTLMKHRPGYRAAAPNLSVDHDHLIKIDREGAYEVLEKLVTYNGAKVVIFDTAYKFFCVDTETEALTQRGWVKHDDLSDSDQILAMDPSDGRLKWSNVRGVFRKRYQGDMFHLTNQSMDAMVTPGHKLLTERGLVKVDDLKARDVVLTMGSAEPSTAEIYDDAFVELVGWSVTEGNYWESEVSRACTVTITQNPGEMADRIELCLKRVGAEWTETKSGTSSRAFRMRGQVARNIIDLTPDRVPSLPFMLSLSSHQRQLLIETMIDGDGSRSNGIVNYSQKCARHTDAFVMLCTLQGIPTTTAFREFETSTPNGNRYDCKIYTVTLKSTKQSHVRCMDWHGSHPRKQASHEPRQPSVPYDDLVWCPETQYGTFVARRNGRVFVTGNSKSMDNATSMTAAFEVLDKLIHETGVSVVLTHHNKKTQKNKSGPAQDIADPDDVAGSFLWTGWPNATISLNYMSNSVENPFNAVCTFTAFRDAAPPEPLGLYRSRDSVAYSAVRQHVFEGGDMSSGMHEKTKPSTELVMQWLLANTPVPEHNAMEELCAMFGVRDTVVKPYFLDAMQSGYFRKRGKPPVIEYYKDSEGSWEDDRQLHLIPGGVEEATNKTLI